MREYLTFALVAPLASFGGIAVGERRGGWDRPARSAVLGLVGACLGLEREDDEAQAALARDYGLALLCHAPGRLLADYHTAQVPPAARNRRFATRAAELAAPDLNTVLSRRDYRSGAWHLGALWTRSDSPRWPLEQVQEAMERPGFVPYLGRKSCPLGLPLAPELTVVESPVAALRRRHAEGREARLMLPLRRQAVPLRDALADQVADTVIVLDAEDAGQDPRLLRVEMRRDQPRSRRRWQFDLRQEAVLRGTEA